MSYRINIEKTAVKKLKKLPQLEQKRIGKKLRELEQNPRPRDCKKLKGETNLYRIRSGNYRVIYSIQDAELIVLVIRVGHRSSIYE
ncbi:mRNA interferase RelE [Acaryochloris thomasi RCC1774]|uniref:mRNA interferase RelE n=1 Tax=Acaryochloris thomasi RCC1774 TaxID=1764569 RepID=A0A2W1JU24_9CYAN|nr:type II toxin-antitoxin system RelE/ParE family toxin [Acaryochloris thomasi]PZD74032.1 mRNA interferase RelE [Acaryochloris thomasi RCC1774]